MTDLFRVRVGVFTLTTTLLLQPAMAQPIRPDYAMFSDPQLDVAERPGRLAEGQVALWQEVLARPEVDYQRLAAEAIAQAAQEGLPGLEPALPQLRSIVRNENAHPAAVHAAARALITLQDHPSAEALWEAAQQSSLAVRLLVEPAMADWEFAPARTVWRERLDDPLTTRRELILALEGLAKLGDAGSLETVLKFVHAAARPADVRFAAARTAGVLARTGLEGDAARLLASGASETLSGLCAVELLSRHDTTEAVNLLQQLAVSSEPTIAEQALARLLAIDPELALPAAEAAVRRSDPKVRSRGADVYVALPTTERIGTLADLLDDVHPDVRGGVRDDLYELARQPELAESVHQQAMRILGSSSWRGQEQAALLLGALVYEPAAERLVELLTASRPEVMVATAWALRKLSVDQSREAILKYVTAQTLKRLEGHFRPGLDEQIAHLCEALGLMNAEDADSVLRRYIAKKGQFGHDSRGAAIWALGLLHADSTDEGLAELLAGRLTDFDIINPELPIVIEMSAVSLARMQSSSQLPALQSRMRVSVGRTLLAARWAIEQITGEPLPPLESEALNRMNWFLEPASGVQSSPEGP